MLARYSNIFIISSSNPYQIQLTYNVKYLAQISRVTSTDNYWNVRTIFRYLSSHPRIHIKSTKWTYNLKYLTQVSRITSKIIETFSPFFRNINPFVISSSSQIILCITWNINSTSIVYNNTKKHPFCHFYPQNRIKYNNINTTSFLSFHFQIHVKLICTT